MQSKPKLSIYKVINKSLIAWDIKNNFDIPVYYKWDEKRVPKINKETNEFDLPFIYIDYDVHKCEWYVQYVGKNLIILSSTINDITSEISISSYGKNSL